MRVITQAGNHKQGGKKNITKDKITGKSPNQEVTSKQEGQETKAWDGTKISTSLRENRRSHIKASIDKC